MWFGVEAVWNRKSRLHGPVHFFHWLLHMPLNYGLSNGSDVGASALISLVSVDCYHRPSVVSSPLGGVVTAEEQTRLCGSIWCQRKPGTMFRTRHPNKRWRRRFVERRTDPFRTFPPRSTLDVIPPQSGGDNDENQARWCQESILKLTKWAAASSILSSDSTSYSGYVPRQQHLHLGFPRPQASWQDVSLFPFSVELRFVLLFVGCRLFHVKGTAATRPLERRTCLAVIHQPAFVLNRRLFLTFPTVTDIFPFGIFSLSFLKAVSILGTVSTFGPRFQLFRVSALN